MMQLLLNLLYKGDRTYLQGPDILNETMGWLAASGLPEARDIDFSFHRLARHQLTASFDAPPIGVRPAAVCAFTANGVRRKVNIIETDRPVVGRKPYPEDEIVAAMEIDSDHRRVVLSRLMPYTEVEIWVSMTKALHQRVFPHLSGKWLFVRGRLPKYVRHVDSPRREVTITATLGNKLTRSEVSLDGVNAGEIYFSIV